MEVESKLLEIIKKGKREKGRSKEMKLLITRIRKQKRRGIFASS